MLSAFPVGAVEPERVVETQSPWATLRGLDPTKDYLLQVKAVNALGTSNTVTSQAVRPAVEATVPMEPTLSYRLERRAATFTFNAADGGTPIYYYQWYLSGPVEPGHTSGSGGPEGYARVTGLIPGEQYHFTVYAHNAMGDGPAAVVDFTAADVPAAPTAVAVKRGDESATVSWQPPNDRGSTVLGYQVVRVSDNRVVATTDGDARSARVTGLVNGQRQRFAVRARNALGSGPLSSAVSVVPAGRPGQTPGVRASAGVRKATVTWKAAPSNGAAIRKYRVSTSTGRTVVVGASARSYTLAPVARGKRVRFTVTAVNDVGAGPAARSNAVTVR